MYGAKMISCDIYFSEFQIVGTLLSSDSFLRLIPEIKKVPPVFAHQTAPINTILFVLTNFCKDRQKLGLVGCLSSAYFLKIRMIYFMFSNFLII